MSDVWSRVRRLEGETLTTLRNPSPFLVIAVGGANVRIVTRGGKGSPRSIPRAQIEHIAAQRLSREESRIKTMEEYPKSQNTSYIAAIAYEANRRA